MEEGINFILQYYSHFEKLTQKIFHGQINPGKKGKNFGINSWKSRFCTANSPTHDALKNINDANFEAFKTLNLH